MKYGIFKIASKEVHVPSSDYYARSNDSQTSDIEVLERFNDQEEFDTPEEAYNYLKELKGNTNQDAHKYILGSYIIVPVFNIK